MTRPYLMTTLRTINAQIEAEAEAAADMREAVAAAQKTAEVHPEVIAMADLGRAEEDRLSVEKTALELEAAIIQAAEDTARKDAERHADAIGAVQREKQRHGHDLTATRGVDAQAIDIIRAALAMVANSQNSPADLVKGAEIARALGGEQ